MWKLSAVFVAIILSNVGGYKFGALLVVYRIWCVSKLVRFL